MTDDYLLNVLLPYAIAPIAIGLFLGYVLQRCCDLLRRHDAMVEQARKDKVWKDAVGGKK